MQSLDFDVVVFDTAPTGHTLRLLSFPTIMEKALGKVMELKDRFGGLIGQAMSVMGGQNPAAAQDQLLGQLEETRAIINKVNDAFQDPTLTTFVRNLVSRRICNPDNFSQCNHLIFVLICRFVSVSQNSFPFMRLSALFRNCPNSVSIHTILL